MRIFEVIESSANPYVPNSRIWLRNLYEPLVDMGIEVILFPAEDGRKAMFNNDNVAREVFSQTLLDKFRRENKKRPFDLFFAYLMDGMVDPGVIDEVRKYGIPTCNFSCNNIHQFYLVDELSTHFDYNLHAEKYARHKFLNIGATPLWWPMASNPNYFTPKDFSRTIPVSFVGSNYALRARYIAHLLENGVNVHVYGPGWKTNRVGHLRSFVKHYILILRALSALSVEKQARSSALLADFDFRRNIESRFPQNLHGAVSDDDLIDLYSYSCISLGFLEVYELHDPSRSVIQHLHLRDFEAPMCGALYFTGYSDELAEMFEPDKEVVVFRNQNELLDKVHYYLARPEEAEEIRRAGRKRALRDHTYHMRFRQLFKELNLL
jgi:hypothetical protein